MKKIYIVLIAFCVLFSTMTACYAKGPWRGKVIDAETKQPIEGAVVVAVWYKSLRGPAGMETLFLDAKETLTDKDGRFEIPSFSALHIPIVREITGPTFTIYKPGYGSFPEFIEKPHNIGDDITPWLYKMEHIFEKQEDIVELPKVKSNKDRQQVLNVVLARKPLNKEARLQIIDKLIVSEKKYLKENNR